MSDKQTIKRVARKAQRQRFVNHIRKTIASDFDIEFLAQMAGNSGAANPDSSNFMQHLQFHNDRWRDQHLSVIKRAPRRRT